MATALDSGVVLGFIHHWEEDRRWFQMDPQVLTDEEIRTTWNRAGAGTATMHADPDTDADPDTKDADGTDGDTTDTVDGDADTDGDTTDKTDGDADGTDS